jgi:hypothetical protein
MHQFLHVATSLAAGALLGAVLGIAAVYWRMTHSEDTMEGIL